MPIALNYLPINTNSWYWPLASCSYYQPEVSRTRRPGFPFWCLAGTSILLRTLLRSKARRSPGGVPARNRAAPAQTVRYALVILRAASFWARIIRFRQIVCLFTLSAHVDEACSSLLFTTDNSRALLGPPRLGMPS